LDDDRADAVCDHRLELGREPRALVLDRGFGAPGPVELQRERALAQLPL
jgi:hypothetical protein